jgi:hypothetical protein
MSEAELREAFREIAAEVRPAPEAYPRLMRREVRQRRVRVAGWTTAVAAGMAAVLFGPVGLQGLAGKRNEPWTGSSGGTTPSTEPDGVAALTPWTRALIQGPPQGELTEDRAFTDTLSEALRHMNIGPRAGLPVKVLFAGDVGEHRIVVAARYDDANTGVQTGIFLTALKGASIAELTSDDTAMVVMRPLKPFTRLSYLTGSGPVVESGVALAPPDCTISTARADDVPPQWEPAPSINLLVWSEPADRLLSKVECAGVVRYQGPAADGDNTFVGAPSDADVDTATAGMRGSVPRDVARNMVAKAIWLRPAGQIKILYGGTLPGRSDPAYLGYFPMGNGYWTLLSQKGSQSGAYRVRIPDPGGATAIVTVPLEGATTYAVVAPLAAVSLRVDGATIPLANGVAVVDLAPGTPVVALDAEGRQVGPVTVPPPRDFDQVPVTVTTDNWR